MKLTKLKANEAIHMKSTLAALLLLSFTIIAVFGVFAMNHGAGNGHGDGGCIASMVKGVDCPKDAGSLQFLTFHLDAFRSFSTASFGSDFASAFLLLVVFLLTMGAGIIAGVKQAPMAPTPSHIRRQFLESHSFSSQLKLTHWLSLHENSPSVL